MLELLKKREKKHNPEPMFSKQDLEKLAKFWSEKSMKQDKKIAMLLKYYEKNEKSRYARCFGLFKIIAMRRQYGDDHLGFAIAKNKSMEAAGLRFLKHLSSKELLSFQDFLVYLSQWDHLPINTQTFQVWKNSVTPKVEAEREIIDFILGFKPEAYSKEQANLLVIRIANLKEKLLKKNVTS